MFVSSSNCQGCWEFFATNLHVSHLKNPRVTPFQKGIELIHILEFYSQTEAQWFSSFQVQKKVSLLRTDDESLKIFHLEADKNYKRERESG